MDDILYHYQRLSHVYSTLFLEKLLFVLSKFDQFNQILIDGMNFCDTTIYNNLKQAITISFLV